MVLTVAAQAMQAFCADPMAEKSRANIYIDSESRDYIAYVVQDCFKLNAVKAVSGLIV